jgi:chromosomal replication initiator protein
MNALVPPPVVSDVAWKLVEARLRSEFPKPVYDSWLVRLQLERIEGDVAHLTVPTKFLKSWIEAHYAERVLAAVSAEFRVGRISIEIRSPYRVGRDAVAAAVEKIVAPVVIEEEARPPAPSVTRADTIFGSPLEKRFTFASFVVGNSNRLAHSAAIRTAQTKPGNPILFNPLYIHAPVGLGKTHLIQAIANEACSAGRAVVYLTAEKFMYELVAALKTQTGIDLRRQLGVVDFLIIDDAQFLQGKSIQDEFFHVVNALYAAGRQIVVAAEGPPHELEQLHERLKSRLASGLCVDMGGFDEEVRIGVIEARMAAARAIEPEFTLAPEVVGYLVQTFQSNGRELEGAVTRLAAHWAVSDRRPLTLEMAENAVRDLIRTREPKRIKIEDIQKLVASHYNVSRSDIMSSRRTANVVRPRQVAMALSKQLTLRSLPEIGRRFGGRDHTTVLHAVRKMEDLCGRDGMLADEMAFLKNVLTGSGVVGGAPP